MPLKLLGTISSSVQKASTSFESIATATGTGSSGNITFSSIPSTYQHLQIRISAISSCSYIGMNFNSDTGSNYTWHQLRGTGTTTSVTGISNSTELYPMGSLSANNSYPYVGIIDILDYKDSNKFKTMRSLYGTDNNGTVGYQTVALSSGVWRNTTAISTILVFASGGEVFQTGTHIALYGIKAAS